jgi:hypothetical protein
MTCCVRTGACLTTNAKTDWPPMPTLSPERSPAGSQSPALQCPTPSPTRRPNGRERSGAGCHICKSGAGLHAIQPERGPRSGARPKCRLSRLSGKFVGPTISRLASIVTGQVSYPVAPVAFTDRRHANSAPLPGGGPDCADPWIRARQRATCPTRTRNGPAPTAPEPEGIRSHPRLRGPVPQRTPGSSTA